MCGLFFGVCGVFGWLKGRGVPWFKGWKMKSLILKVKGDGISVKNRFWEIFEEFAWKSKSLIVRIFKGVWWVKWRLRALLEGGTFWWSRWTFWLRRTFYNQGDFLRFNWAFLEEQDRLFTIKVHALIESRYTSHTPTFPQSRYFYFLV